jgi:hypothetical protein
MGDPYLKNLISFSLKLYFLSLNILNLKLFLKIKKGNILVTEVMQKIKFGFKIFLFNNNKKIQRNICKICTINILPNNPLILNNVILIL